jgi:amino acid adenylation domain-containing protein
MLNDARTAALLSHQRFVEKLPVPAGRGAYLDTDWSVIARESAVNPENWATPDNPAYLIYTSGSSGIPKGVVNAHRGVCNRLLWMQDVYRLTTQDHVLQKTPFSFDVSVWEFFWPLLVGARLVMARPGGHQDSGYLADLIAEERITTLHFVPSMLQAFLEEDRLSRCGSLKDVISSGEALPFELKERFFTRLGAELHNLYGPTEASVDVTFWHCERDGIGRSVPIGRPIANTQIYLLDSNMEPVPVGVAGELHIGGVGLGRGYHNRAELTAEKFVPNPYRPDREARLYKTGDLARYLPDGQIEYIGRIDHQVKIRGFRIELREIETLLTQHLGVKSAVVVAQEQPLGDMRLAAYIVPDELNNTNSLIDDLRGLLKGKLPEYMVPSTITVMDALPLTPSGKVDRRSLPFPDRPRGDSERAFVGPRTPIEAEIAELWRELLGLEEVSIYDNFFNLGGHSLLLTQLASRIRKLFQVELSLRVLFDALTIVQMTEAILEQQVVQADAAEVSEMLEQLKQFSSDEIKALLEDGQMDLLSLTK